MVLATPVLAISLLLVVAERLFGVGIFDPGPGGDPLLFQHLFWFYGHPAVYIMVLPGIGVVSRARSRASRGGALRLHGDRLRHPRHRVIGFLVWGHHMFVAGDVGLAGMVFSFLSFRVAIPSAIKVFNWTAYLLPRADLLRRAAALRPRLRRPLHYRRPRRAFTSLAADRCPVTDTYFVVAHFHSIMVGGAAIGLLRRPSTSGGRVTGRMEPERLEPICRHPPVFRLQLHLLPAVPHGLSRDEPALPPLCARVPDLPRDLVTRGGGARGGRIRRRSATSPGRSSTANARAPIPGAPQGWNGRRRPRPRARTSSGRRLWRRRPTPIIRKPKPRDRNIRAAASRTTRKARRHDCTADPRAFS